MASAAAIPINTGGSTFVLSEASGSAAANASADGDTFAATTRNGSAFSLGFVATQAGVPNGTITFAYLPYGQPATTTTVAALYL